MSTTTDASRTLRVGVVGLGFAGTTHLDAARMSEGGLDAQFFSVWVEPEFYGTGGERAIARADAQVEAVRALAERRPDIWPVDAECRTC